MATPSSELPGELKQLVDLDLLEAAGIQDAHDRALLIEYLDTLGFTAEEMVEAHRH